jgi:uncharacterized protein
MSDQLIFPVAELLQKQQGTKEEYEIDADLEDAEDLKLKKNVKAKVALTELHNDVHVEIKDLDTSVEGNCNKCLKNYSQNIKISLIEREFLFEEPENMEDPDGFCMIDKKEMTVDLTEVLRQEILLHFPLIPVCSKGCKGLCPKCGIDLNKKQCDCKPEDPDDQKPLAILKQFK